MAQRAQENVKNEYIEEKIDFKEILTKLFSVQNIVIYIITFMISMVSFTQSKSTIIAPFGIALVCASISSKIPIAIVFLAGLLGTAIKFGKDQVLIYIVSFLIMFVLTLIKKPKENNYDLEKDSEPNEKIMLGSYIAISVLFANVIKMAFTGFYIYDIMVSTIYSISVYIFYKIFVNSIDVIQKYRFKEVFSIEEVIGACLLITIAITAIGNFKIFNFSLRNILCILIVLIEGYRNGILVGTTSGVTVGIVLGIIGNGDPILIATYAISGMIAGVLNKFGKIGVIIGFIIGNIIIAYSDNGGTKNIIMFQEILIASIGLLAMPKKLKINIEDILPKTKLLPEATGMLEESADTILKLDSISDTISKISKEYKKDNSIEENKRIYEEEVFKNLTDENIIKNEKIDKNILYSYFYENNNELLDDILKNIMENSILTQNALISILAKHNIYVMNSNDAESNANQLDDIRQMMRILNVSYMDCKKDMIFQKKIAEKEKNMSNDLDNVKEAIDNISKNIEETSKIREENKDEISKLEEKLKNKIKNEGINNITKAEIKRQKTGRNVVNVYTNVCDSNEINCPVKRIGKIAENVLNKKFVLQDQKCGLRLEKKYCEFTYLEDDKFILQTGMARAKKDNSIVSGDTTLNVRLGDGKYLLAISDGMGSGPEARKNSKIAISMLERLLDSGFDKDTSINLINSAILNANKEDMYATLDIEILDLFSGKVEFIKNGACPTYIKRNKNVSILESTSLPAGITSKVNLDTFDSDLENNEIIVCVSDGIIESNNEYDNKELWLKYLLEDIQTDVPERIAEIILNEAIDNNMGKPKDDMSVIVSKVIKKEQRIFY